IDANERPPAGKRRSFNSSSLPSMPRCGVPPNRSFAAGEMVRRHLSNHVRPTPNRHCDGGAAASSGSTSESKPVDRLGNIPCDAARAHVLLDTSKRSGPLFVVQILHRLLLRVLGDGATFHIAWK